MPVVFKFVFQSLDLFFAPRDICLVKGSLIPHCCLLLASKPVHIFSVPIGLLQHLLCLQQILSSCLLLVLLISLLVLHPVHCLHQVDRFNSTRNMLPNLLLVFCFLPLVRCLMTSNLLHHLCFVKISLQGRDCPLLICLRLMVLIPIDHLGRVNETQSAKIFLHFPHFFPFC